MASADRSRDLLAQARALEAQAALKAEESASGRELRSRAAQLRVEALGERVYPVRICMECSRVTGWTSSDGRCDSCLRRDQTRAAFTDPHGGFVLLEDTRPLVRHDDRPSAGPSLLAEILGGRGAHERALAHSWRSRVEPDVTGPIDHEEGYEVEAAHRDEVEAPDGSTMLVRFRTAAHRFVGGRWLEQERTKIGFGALLIPAEHSAGLPTEQLVEAWLDYKAAVDEFNRAAWSRESAAREADRAARAAHDDMIRDQRDAAELLDED